MKMIYFFYFTLYFSALMIAYSYLFYPAWLWIYSTIKPGRKKSRIENGNKLPTVSIVIAAYNEEKVIEEKIKNALGLDYPAELIEILIGSDGSEDKTDEICSRYAKLIHFTRIEPRQGKANVLNTIVPLANGEIILFSDANTILKPDCLKNIVFHFANPEIGGVCGRLELMSSKEAIVSFERLYWKYESAIKMMESQLHSTIGSNGGIYAIRKELFTKIPKDTIVDDFWISIDILEQQKRISFEKEAVAYERLSKSIIEEFSRKVRIGGGNMQTYLRRPVIRNQKQKIINFSYYSHKVIRWSIPFLLIFFYVSLYALRNHDPLQALFFLLNLSIFLSLVGILFEIKNKFLETLSYFYLFNAALLIGYFRYLTGKQSVIWKIAKR